MTTKPTRKSVDKFLRGVDPARQEDCRALVELMSDITGEPPVMWGPSIVGFGTYHYKYDSGREGDFFLTGFSPRARDLTVYVMAGFSKYEALMKKLGKHKTGKSCLYIKSLDEVHRPTLKELVRRSVAHMMKSNA